MKIDKWFLMILIMLVIFSLWAIIVTGNADSGGTTVYMPAVVNPVAGMRGDCVWPNIYDKKTQPACWCIPTPDEGPDYVPWGCWDE